MATDEKLSLWQHKFVQNFHYLTICTVVIRNVRKWKNFVKVISMNLLYKQLNVRYNAIISTTKVIVRCYYINHVKRKKYAIMSELRENTSKWTTFLWIL